MTTVEPTTDAELATEAQPATDPGADYSVLAAQVTGAHGVTGNLRLKLIGANADLTAQSLERTGVVRAARGPGDPVRRLTFLSLRRQAQPKGAWIGRFRDVRDRTEAEALIGYGLYITESQRAPLPDDEYYVDQLLGLELKTDTGHALGRLVDVLAGPANDVYVTDTGVMVPAVSAFLLSVNIAGGVITVKDIPGLRDAP